MQSELDNLQRLANSLKNFGIEDSSADDELHPFDARNVHQKISSVCLKLFDDGHYSQATFEAFKYIDKEVERLSGISETGKSLMMRAFKEDNPLVALNSLQTASERNEQEGYKYIFAGAMIGIRNPRGHEFGNVDTIEECLDHLSLASQLLRVLDEKAVVSP